MPGSVMESLFDLGIGLNGWIAMAIAVVGIIALNVGLMRLMRLMGRCRGWSPSGPGGCGRAR